MTVQSNEAGGRFTVSANPQFAPPPPAAPVELIRVGPAPTDVIPRVWAESILCDLRAEKPGIWRTLLGKASTPQ